ncbi:YniB family protein [Ralstonia mannitolilytica]|uniref:YniB family protein n=1 Tax=Ralstonia mannitolilytica TaxID=105219 RepID=UPI0014258443|nr:YniB family protein [Ralstonia mannitolilytica]
MKILEAKKHVTRLRIAGLIILACTFVLFAFAALKSLYFAMSDDRTAFSVISQAVQRLIYVIYEKTQFAELIWKAAPVVNPRDFNTTGNLGFLLIVLAGGMGRTMVDSAAHLSARIAKTIQRVEELGWEQSLLAQQGTVSSGGKPDVLQINIELDQKDQWYKRPIGLILLGVAIAVLGQLANLKFGLVK